MGTIKRLTCLTSTRSCVSCPLKSSCIYYHLSGENFTKYPAITIRRNLVEQIHYSNTERLSFDLFLIGNVKFRGYIESFFSELRSIDRQPVLIDEISIKAVENELVYDKAFRVSTPLSGFGFQEQIDYYHSRYGVMFALSMSNKIIQERQVYDKTRYRLDTRTFSLSGVLGRVHIHMIDRSLLLIGLGSTNFIGGGRLDEIEG